MACGIYKFENNINHMVYIGQTIDLESRYKKHFRQTSGYIEQALSTYTLFAQKKSIGADVTSYFIKKYTRNKSTSKSNFLRDVFMDYSLKIKYREAFLIDSKYANSNTKLRNKAERNDWNIYYKQRYDLFNSKCSTNTIMEYNDIFIDIHKDSMIISRKEEVKQAEYLKMITQHLNTI